MYNLSTFLISIIAITSVYGRDRINLKNLGLDSLAVKVGENGLGTHNILTTSRNDRSLLSENSQSSAGQSTGQSAGQSTGQSAGQSTTSNLAVNANPAGSSQSSDTTANLNTAAQAQANAEGQTPSIQNAFGEMSGNDFLNSFARRDNFPEMDYYEWKRGYGGPYDGYDNGYFYHQNNDYNPKKGRKHHKKDKKGYNGKKYAKDSYKNAPKYKREESSADHNDFYYPRFRHGYYRRSNEPLSQESDYIPRPRGYGFHNRFFPRSVESSDSYGHGSFGYGYGPYGYSHGPFGYSHGPFGHGPFGYGPSKHYRRSVEPSSDSYGPGFGHYWYGYPGGY